MKTDKELQEECYSKIGNCGTDLSWWRVRVDVEKCVTFRIRFQLEHILNQEENPLNYLPTYIMSSIYVYV
jgi:hypothetical protein